MSKSPLLDPDGSIEDLSDEELLERIANLDPDTYPLVPIVRDALHRQEGSS
jgi:hypothetical protein